MAELTGLLGRGHRTWSSLCVLRTLRVGTLMRGAQALLSGIRSNTLANKTHTLYELGCPSLRTILNLYQHSNLSTSMIPYKISMLRLRVYSRLHTSAFTEVRGLFYVSLLMLSEPGASIKGFATFVTFIRFLSSVNPLMYN